MRVIPLQDLKKDSAPLSYNKTCGFMNSVLWFVTTKPLKNEVAHDLKYYCRKENRRPGFPESLEPDPRMIL